MIMPQYNVRMSPQVVGDIDALTTQLGLTRGAYFMFLHERYKREILSTLCQPIKVETALDILRGKLEEK
jgi:hypothetical protein